MNYPQVLKQIIIATGWSQEQLALRLGVTFSTINSWINDKSTPRANAQQNIDKLHLEIVGADVVDQTVLIKAKKAAYKLKISVKTLANNKDLLNKLTLHLTYHTNNIEGSTMTLSDVEGVIMDNKVLANRTAIEQTEARNHQATLHWLIDQLMLCGKDFRITEELVYDINLRLMHGIISNAGIYRNHGVRILGSRTAVTNWPKIPERMATLVKNLDEYSDDIVGTIAKTHSELEKIHPFSDGNGRTGRLIMLAQALMYGVVPPIVVKERKNAYYKYLELAQTKEQFEPLEMFVAESMLHSHSLLFGQKIS